MKMKVFFLFILALFAIDALAAPAATPPATSTAFAAAMVRPLRIVRSVFLLVQIMVILREGYYFVIMGNGAAIKNIIAYLILGIFILEAPNFISWVTNYQVPSLNWW